jgi:hypothetical protein
VGVLPAFVDRLKIIPVGCRVRKLEVRMTLRTILANAIKRMLNPERRQGLLAKHDQALGRLQLEKHDQAFGQ